jgi:hypothetical protein
MKRITLALALLLLATHSFAQEAKPAPKPEEFNTVREYKNKVFEIHNRSARDLYTTIALLGSGFQGAKISYNTDLNTITVRDFPENIASIEDALKRLDKPAAAKPEIELKISVLIASKTPLASASVPDELAPVVKQLQATLRYANYGLMSTTIHRTSLGEGLEGSGVADASLLGLKVNEERPIVYRYRVRDITSAANAERPTIDVRNFEFNMNVPIVAGNGVQYQPVGFQTPVSIRENEKVVIGTTTMGDKALIVVVTATTGAK